MVVKWANVFGAGGLITGSCCQGLNVEMLMVSGGISVFQKRRKSVCF